jgi:ubiquitin-protein ligase E3 C
VHLLATLHVLTPPRYQKLKADALSAYLRLLTLLLNATPISTLNPPEKRSANSQSWHAAHDLDSDSDSETPGGSRSQRSISVSVVSSFDAPMPLPPSIPTLDSRIVKRLTTLPSAVHIAALLSCKEIHTSAVLPALIECLFALSTAWPAVLGAVLATGAGLVREVYKEFVRGSVLGKNADGAATLLDPQNGREWPALLFLTDLYEQALRTMGDDEFFGSSDSGAGGEFTSHSHVLGSSSSSGRGVGAVGATQAQRNPLTLDELRAFSRQLLNIAFVLYWREDGGDANGSGGIMGKLVGAGGEGSNGGAVVRCTWEGVREKVTKCLVGIHARE